MNHYESLLKKLEDRKEKKSLRELGSQFENSVDFCSNDYLGLSRQPISAEAGASGSTGSRLISGNSTEAEIAETAIANFADAEAALIFPTGYMANLGIFACLGSRNDTFIFDEHSHASIRDGLRLSLARSYSFRHNDVDDLRSKITKASGNIFIITEGIFSMDGDCSPADDLVKICHESGARLIIDEAHSIGSKGKKGEGLYDGQNEAVFARILTFGKAFGLHGAAITGSTVLRDYLINFSRPFIYSTAPPPNFYTAITRRLAEVINATQQRKQLQQLISFSPYHDDSPVGKIIIPGNEQARQLAEHLKDQGFFVKAVLHPTVPQGTERLRICLHSYNTPDQLQQFTNILQRSENITQP